jgi:hypothetical protein
MMWARRARTRISVAVAAAAFAALLSACSSSSSSGAYPTLFAEPPPRSDAPLTPDEVKQATDTLLTDREHLCAEAIANAQPGAPPPDCATQTGTAGKPAAGTGAKP